MSEMNNSDQIIDQLIRGEISDAERNRLLAIVEADPRLKEEYQKMQALISTIHDVEKQGLRKELDELENNISRKNKTRQKILLAGAIIAAIALGAWLISLYTADRKTEKAEVLYATYYEPHPNVIDPITKGENAAALSAIQHYELGNYDKAIERLRAKDRTNIEEWYYAQALLATDQYNEAYLLFDNIAKSDTTYSSSALWFISLIHLHNGEINKTKELLNQLITTQDSGYVYRAKDLISEL